MPEQEAGRDGHAALLQQHAGGNEGVESRRRAQIDAAYDENDRRVGHERPDWHSGSRMDLR